MSIAHRRSSGVLDDLRTTPLGADHLAGAVVRCQVRRAILVLLCLAPVAGLALNWAGWLALVTGRESLPFIGERFSLVESPAFFTAPYAWARAVTEPDTLRFSAAFGTALVASDLLAAWRAAALGAWLGARLKSAAVAVPLAVIGAGAFWLFRALVFGCSAAAGRPAPGPSAFLPVVLAFSADLAVLAWLGPFFLERARRALASSDRD